MGGKKYCRDTAGGWVFSGGADPSEYELRGGARISIKKMVAIRKNHSVRRHGGLMPADACAGRAFRSGIEGHF